MGKEEDRQGCSRICFQNRITQNVIMSDVPWCCAALLPPVCTVIVSVTGAGLTLKHVFDLLGFFRLWTIENAVVIGFQPPHPGGGSIQLNMGVRLVVSAFSRKTWREKMPFKENYCIAYQLKTKVFCPVNHLEALSCQSQGRCLLFTSARLCTDPLSPSFKQTSIGGSSFLIKKNYKK